MQRTLVGQLPVLSRASDLARSFRSTPDVATVLAYPRGIVDVDPNDPALEGHAPGLRLNDRPVPRAVGALPVGVDQANGAVLIVLSSEMQDPFGRRWRLVQTPEGFLGFVSFVDPLGKANVKPLPGASWPNAPVVYGSWQIGPLVFQPPLPPPPVPPVSGGTSRVGQADVLLRAQNFAARLPGVSVEAPLRALALQRPAPPAPTFQATGFSAEALPPPRPAICLGRGCTLYGNDGRTRHVGHGTRLTITNEKVFPQIGTLLYVVAQDGRQGWVFPSEIFYGRGLVP